MITFQNVSKTFNKKNTTIHALNDVSFTVDQGDIFGVIGYSGAGKSTLVRLVNQLEKQTSGDVYVDNHHLNTYTQADLRKVKKDIGMIFQHFNLLNAKTVFKNVAMPLILRKVNPKEIEQRVNEMLAFVGLEGKAQQYPTELSGGQKQRVAIARALVTNPKILLCDEATSALDPATTDAILDLLKKTNETFGVTILVITHEMSVIQKICNRVAVMEQGSVIELDSVKNVFSHPKTPTAKRFVSTVINTEPSAQVVQQLSHIDHAHVYRLFIESDQISNAIVHDLIAQFEVKVNIIHAFMAEIQDDTVGYLWLQVVGESPKQQAVQDYLTTQHIQYEEVTADARFVH
ncbi:methionine ABC transporter ATP-binding protein [Staphylococcus microti]|uniref:Methionine ABC transporter ATP-binding protein n=1 Tax=Staphylococcus microti TaxID=569857 RepID=A0A0D6XQM2_9STAP|nr:methionine ABC transporter ATP-binding protein [Staphylococcus microti]KIX90867.1 methionine ABC transporter ATP-binding protein [Staphylococcus microti]PNZ79837.1 methionine ABC transporter ATP-binding protein [Staphylococcus microti]SUM58564.1 methionine import ATP-binding protein MetN [Staphylococcus microti]